MKDLVESLSKVAPAIRYDLYFERICDECASGTDESGKIGEEIFELFQELLDHPTWDARISTLAVRIIQFAWRVASPDRYQYMAEEFLGAVRTKIRRPLGGGAIAVLCDSYIRMGRENQALEIAESEGIRPKVVSMIAAMRVASGDSFAGLNLLQENSVTDMSWFIRCAVEELRQRPGDLVKFEQFVRANIPVESP